MARVLPTAVSALLLLSLFHGPSRAEQLGVAFVEAPELSYGVCFAAGPEKGFACARKKCITNGGETESCQAVKWCHPAGWSVDLFVQHAEGLHWHEYLCGWPSKADAVAAAGLRCTGSGRGKLLQCEVVGVWTPDGTHQKMPDGS
ncbi:hypothetical protein [Anderseniella sp. Alg231-50]|uniref:hypothetical protein n=1 Tax=Anderseniella sp. Alg231-50 TaxID=1922226 RepID=UPI000D552C49